MPSIYLDNAATSFPKPPAVAEAMLRYMQENGASVNRGVYASAQEAGIPVLCQRLQRAHYGVVFHGADQTVIPWPQPPAKHHVQPHCIAGGQHAVP